RPYGGAEEFAKAVIVRYSPNVMRRAAVRIVGRSWQTCGARRPGRRTAAHHQVPAATVHERIAVGSGRPQQVDGRGAPQGAGWLRRCCGDRVARTTPGMEGSQALITVSRAVRSRALGDTLSLLSRVTRTRCAGARDAGLPGVWARTSATGNMHWLTGDRLRTCIPPDWRSP